MTPPSSPILRLRNTARNYVMGDNGRPARSTVWTWISAAANL